MKLNNEHIVILQKAREHIRSGGTEYICVAIEHVLLILDAKEDSVAQRGLCEELTSAIQCALGASTMLIYLRANVPNWRYRYSLDRYSLEHERSFAYLARLAWLDKIIETREIPFEIP
jgi:hypothetical protein